MQGERRAKRKAVQSERKGNKKRKFLICLFRSAAGFMQRPQDFLFLCRAAACFMKKYYESPHCFCPVGATRPDGWVTQGAASLRSALPWAVCCCPSGAQPDGLELLPDINSSIYVKFPLFTVHPFTL